ncbi:MULTISPECIES: PhzF family phenazine biosynthesis protein [Xenorhabdus]|uniref:PhzF family phenazine biosynthesis protein n=1 Tax=Xenorhabdus TaxID=626 RepID=UPI000691B4E9|nr:MULTISPECIES: PhzF family phenazine biosynthesis protein [Xenorhabdus]
MQARPDYVRLREHDREMNVTGICLYGEHGGNDGPVCGGGNGSVAAFIRHHAVTLPEDGLICSSQGQVLGRDGKLQLTVTDEKILVGGNAVTCISGAIRF